MHCWHRAVPSSTRRGEAGGRCSAGIELAAARRTVHLAEVADIGSALGLSDQVVRHGVRRLCDREGFVREGRGRQSIARVGSHRNDLWVLDGELVRVALEMAQPVR